MSLYVSPRSLDAHYWGIVNYARYYRCRSVRLDGQPCVNPYELDVLGFCKYHTPLKLQCRGLASSTGERCRICWDLDGNLLCEYHYWQRVRCHGVDPRTGMRCTATQGINHHGFSTANSTRLPVTSASITLSRRHGRAASDCRGTNMHNVRCNIPWELDANLLCASRTHDKGRCHGVLVGKGERCSNTDAVDRHGYCPDHGPRDEDILREFIWLEYMKELPGPDVKTEANAVKTESQFKTDVTANLSSAAKKEDVKAAVAVKPELPQVLP